MHLCIICGMKFLVQHIDSLAIQQRLADCVNWYTPTNIQEYLFLCILGLRFAGTWRSS